MADFFEVDLTNYAVPWIDPGKYLVQVSKAELSVSRAGNQMIVLTFRLLKGPQGEAVKGSIVDRLVSTPQSAFRVVNAFQALGVSVSFGGKMSLRPESLVGLTAIVDVDDGEPFNGSVQSEVKGYFPAPKDETAPVAADGGTESPPSESQDLDVAML